MPSNKVAPSAALRPNLHKTEKNKLRNRRRNRNRRNTNKGRNHQMLGKQQLHWKPSMNPNQNREQPQPTEANKSKSHFTGSTPTVHAVGPSAQWNAMYQNAVQWQTKYQTEFWKNVAIRHERKYNELLEKYQEIVSRSKASALPEDDHESDEEFLNADSGEDASEDEAASNEEYLKFMEISRRHQMQRDLEKADVSN